MGNLGNPRRFYGKAYQESPRFGSFLQAKQQSDTKFHPHRSLSLL